MFRVRLLKNRKHYYNLLLDIVNVYKSRFVFLLLNILTIGKGKYISEILLFKRSLSNLIPISV